MFKLDNELVEIMTKVEAKGQQIYLVGGFVRDMILGKSTRDLDLATSMPIPALKELLKDYEIKELNHHYGSIKFEIKTLDVEITQFRKEAKYLDTRHPEDIEFSDDMHEDVLRRDFTMNALYMDKEGAIIDPLDRLNDINLNLIRTIGNPNVRFSEDALRIVRLYRFHTQLGFKMETETLAAAQALLPTIQKLKPIQIKNETIKILSSTNLQKLVGEHKNFIHNLLPNAVFPNEVFNLKNSWEYKLLYMYTFEGLETLFKDWEFASRKRKYLLAFKRIIEDYKKMPLQDLFIKHGSFMWFEMMTLFLNLDPTFVYQRKFRKILSENKARSLSELKITGQDLISMNIPEHLRNQLLLKILFDQVWNNLNNEKTELLEQIARYKHDIH